MDYLIENEWGFAVTLVALLLVAGIFASALWFIFSASETNRKIRWLQVFSRRKRKVDDEAGPNVDHKADDSHQARINR